MAETDQIPALPFQERVNKGRDYFSPVNLQVEQRVQFSLGDKQDQAARAMAAEFGKDVGPRSLFNHVLYVEANGLKLVLQLEHQRDSQNKTMHQLRVEHVQADGQVEVSRHPLTATTPNKLLPRLSQVWAKDADSQLELSFPDAQGKQVTISVHSGTGRYSDETIEVSAPYELGTMLLPPDQYAGDLAYRGAKTKEKPDKGLNEDVAIVDNRTGIYGVFDGVSQANGWIASRVFAAHVQEALQFYQNELTSLSAVKKVVQQALERAAGQLQTYLPEGQVASTTMTLAVPLDEDGQKKVAIISVGDTRLFKVVDDDQRRDVQSVTPLSTPLWENFRWHPELVRYCQYLLDDQRDLPGPDELVPQLGRKTISEYLVEKTIVMQGLNDRGEYEHFKLLNYDDLEAYFQNLQANQNLITASLSSDNIRDSIDSLFAAEIAGGTFLVLSDGVSVPPSQMLELTKDHTLASEAGRNEFIDDLFAELAKLGQTDDATAVVFEA